MNEKARCSELFSKLIGYISSTFPQGSLSEEAGDLKAISTLIAKSELTESEDGLLAYLFTKNDLPCSNNPLDLAQLALSIIEPCASPHTEERKLTTAVDYIRVNSSVNVKIIQGDTPSIKVVANSKRNASKIITRESGNTLHIEQEPTVLMSRNGSVKSIIHGRVGQVISGGVVFGDNMNIDMRGDKMTINGQRMDDIFDSEYIEVTVRTLSTIELNGSSNVTYRNFSEKALAVTILGSGDISLSGNVNQLHGFVMGSGDIKAKELIAKNARLSITGSGAIKANVVNEVDASVTGSGDIKVIGNPAKRSKSVTGSGEIKLV